MTTRVSYGACKQCRAPVLYQGAEYCSPACYGKAYGQRFCALCRENTLELTQESSVCEACAQAHDDVDAEAVARGEQRSALISPDGVFRYVLTRVWAPGAWILFIGLNPSTADAEKDDPTVNWWRRFAHQRGFGGFVAVNQSAFRTSDPKKLEAAGYPVGPDNCSCIIEAAKLCETIVGCWGSSAGRWSLDQGLEIERFLDRDILCFDENADGNPKHPLARGAHRLSVEKAKTKLWSCPF